MNETPEETDQDARNISRRGFVRIVRDSAVVLMLPQALGCRRFGSDDKHPAVATDEATHAIYELKFLTNEETATVDAVTARIIPSDERPGAREGRVVHFIDHLLATSNTIQQRLYREGLQQLNRLCQSRFKVQFANLSEAEQDKVLAQMERREIPEWREAGDFFSTIRNHTIEGMFSDPKYHGNAGRVGWGLMGV
ncbi:MAG: gluconate 2-dehydrogenase subunit 3 family protein [Pyrinomonadaceae bacterium]|nr:gluconate 2-dehydrogenase subunit 3 family protein [Pyrinomonadaceae bacterium]